MEGSVEDEYKDALESPSSEPLYSKKFGLEKNLNQIIWVVRKN